MRTLFVLLLMLVTCTAHAIDDERVIGEMARRTNLDISEIREHYKTGCESGVTFSMRICASFHFIAADLELNDTYQALLKRLSKSSKDKLVKAQRAWVTFRDLNCEFDSSGWEGGSGQPIIFSSCRQTVTEARTKELTEYLKCNDPECPGGP